eukprot:TRINITY_DN2780_c0_g1_i1.p1 TRINITY_DN2780_c0_g1~~TRINITY_DN2780_c0_g1_i1.p1  ORF type:complete len:137 (-),score=27.61 TRINITY_DN2780_c0_g1_i1:71-481(-)
MTLLKKLVRKEGEIEWVLSRGGTKWEAAKYPVRDAIKVALYPIINSMMIAGIIQIPGTMVGTMIGGTDPMLAAQYQVLVYILIFTAGGFGVILQTWFTVMNIFDKDNRLMTKDRLKRKKKGSKDWVSVLLFSFLEF